MGTGVNKLRYEYYCSFHFYYLLGCIVGGGVGGLFIALYIQYGFLSIPALIVVSGFAGSFLTLLLLKTFLCMDRQPFIKTGIIGGLMALVVAIWGVLLGISVNNTVLQWADSGIFALIVCVTVLQFVMVKRIKIYPDRVTIGKLDLYYREMQLVKWGVGSLERTKQELTPAQQMKPLAVLTPLLFESRGKDFSISFYYAVIEMPEKIYVVQPIFWRNSLAQNIRNGWLETWRWDGSTEPPVRWVRPE